MDPRFLKWMGETLCLCASNLVALEKMAASAGTDKSVWVKFSEYMPMLSPPPFSWDEMDAFYRQWLSFLGAVPRSDREVLQKMVAVLEEECNHLKMSMDMLVQGISGVQQMPAAMNQWVDLAKTITAVHREWLEDFKKNWEELSEKEGKKHERKSRKMD